MFLMFVKIFIKIVKFMIYELGVKGFGLGKYGCIMKMLINLKLFKLNVFKMIILIFKILKFIVYVYLFGGLINLMFILCFWK